MPTKIWELIISQVSYFVVPLVKRLRRNAYEYLRSILVKSVTLWETTTLQKNDCLKFTWPKIEIWLLNWYYLHINLHILSWKSLAITVTILQHIQHQVQLMRYTGAGVTRNLNNYPNFHDSWNSLALQIMLQYVISSSGLMVTLTCLHWRYAIPSCI